MLLSSKVPEVAVLSVPRWTRSDASTLAASPPSTASVKLTVVCSTVPSGMVGGGGDGVGGGGEGDGGGGDSGGGGGEGGGGVGGGGDG